MQSLMTEVPEDEVWTGGAAGERPPAPPTASEAAATGRSPRPCVLANFRLLAAFCSLAHTSRTPSYDSEASCAEVACRTSLLSRRAPCAARQPARLPNLAWVVVNVFREVVATIVIMVIWQT